MSDAARETKSEHGRDRAGGRRRRGQGTHSAPDAGDALPTPATLFVVATPIGNLEDITLRALRVLAEVSVVAAEDTRRSANLLRHYRIETPLVSLHEHNEPERASQLLRRLSGGESIALISDAGTPGISDPGSVFVKMARDAGVRVDPIPGPSAVAAALSACGLRFERYAFAGFPPIRSKDRKKWLTWVAQLSEFPVVFFEAPHRIVGTLAEVRADLVNRPIILARELTKAHEEWTFLSGETSASPSANAPADPTASASAGIEARGEFVVILAPQPEATAQPSAATDAEISLLFGQTTEMGVFATRRDAIRTVADRLGLPPKAVFEALERHKKATQT